MGKSLFPLFVHTFASDSRLSITHLRARHLLDDRGQGPDDRRPGAFRSFFPVAHMRQPFDMQSTSQTASIERVEVRRIARRMIPVPTIDLDWAWQWMLSRLLVMRGVGHCRLLKGQRHTLPWRVVVKPIV